MSDVRLWYLDYIENFNGYLIYYRRKALLALIDDCVASLPLPANERSRMTFADRLTLAWNNGWLPGRIGEYLARYPKVETCSFVPKNMKAAADKIVKQTADLFRLEEPA